MELLWIPLGADAHVVRLSGKIYEAIVAFLRRRPRCDLYHSALRVVVPHGPFVIEQAPVPDRHGEHRGVVASGPVGMRWLGRFRIFRYEVRCWREGTIPDADAAVGNPLWVTEEIALALRILEVLPTIPTPVWGRDQLRTGEMWNSNSVISWLLAWADLAPHRLRPPPGGRAPGWNAGIAAARAEMG